MAESLPQLSPQPQSATSEGPAVTRFRYRARAADGSLQRGEIGGADAYSARHQLRQSGLVVEQLAPVAVRRSGWLDTYRCRRRRLWRADLVDALAVLMRAGQPLDHALSRLAESPGRTRDERRVIDQIRDALRDGATLADAVAPHRDRFDQLDVAMLAVGQAAGELPRILDALGAHHQRTSQAGHQLTMALVYPVVVCLLAAGVVAKLGNDVLPRFVELLIEGGQGVPAVTAVVLVVGQFLHAWWWALVPAVAVGWWGLKRWLRRASPTTVLGRLVHGNLIARAKRRVRVADLGETLATLLGAGVPLDEALQVAADTTGERRLAELLRHAASAVRDGRDGSAALGESPLLDPEFIQLLALGEQAGELPGTLARIAERARRAADRTAERVAAAIEPIAVVTLAGIVGVVVMAVVLPLTRLGSG